MSTITDLHFQCSIKVVGLIKIGQCVKCLIFSDDILNEDLDKVIFSRNLLYGDSVFTSFVTQNSKFPFWDEHKKRLIESSKRQFGVDCTNQIESLFINLKDKFQDSTYLRISLSFDSRDYPLGTESFKAQDLFAIIHFEQRKFTPQLSFLDCELIEIQYPNMKIKTPQYAYQLRTKTKNYPIYFDQHGVAEAISSNVFFIKDNLLCTPKHPNILNGIIKEKILTEFKVIELPIALEEIKNFEAGFLTNSVKLVQGINSLNKKNMRRSQLTIDVFNFVKGFYE
jgi:branched-subunit amino acid aminotransferase/4-amino-4-deoxychorismate lyase